MGVQKSRDQPCRAGWSMCGSFWRWAVLFLVIGAKSSAEHQSDGLLAPETMNAPDNSHYGEWTTTPGSAQQQPTAESTSESKTGKPAGVSVRGYVVNLAKDTERLAAFNQWWRKSWPDLEIDRLEGITKETRGQGILLTFIEGLKMAEASGVDVAIFLEDDAKPFETEKTLKENVHALIEHW